MNTINSVSQMAAFATLKSLSDEKRYQNSYQLLAEFIRHIVSEKKIYLFETAEMKNLLAVEFGFVIPEAVIKTALRKMAGIVSSKNKYEVNFAELGSDSLFEEKEKEASEINADMISLLVGYIRERTGDDVRKDVLMRELVSSLIGDTIEPGHYIDTINEFILINEERQDIQDCLNNIKEGSVLYLGLNHDIRETGSITKPLTLYLTTEILFSLVGYNGTIYKQFADDFYSQVRTANNGGIKKINLRFFSEVKFEINDFFKTAADIVDGKTTQYNEKPAMVAIINGCETSSDVYVKESDFYHTLQYSYGIVEDSKTDYYDEIHFESNLESFDYEDEDDKKNKKEMGIKYVSHINKLRNGQIFENDIDSEFMLITNTKATLLISQEQTERIKNEQKKEYIANFAISLDRITSLLWIKLGNGFGNKLYPSTINAVLGARSVLSASIAKKAGKVFFETKKEYENGIITKEQLAGRISTLKNKPKLPEDLQKDVISEIMDFSPEFLSRYEEEHNSNRKALDEAKQNFDNFKNKIATEISAKDATIASQEAEITEKNKSITEKEATIEAQNNRIEAQNAELEGYHQRDVKEKKKKEKRKKFFCFALSIFLKLVGVAFVVFVSLWICNRVNPTISTAIGIIIGVLSLIPVVISVIRKDLKKYL